MSYSRLQDGYWHDDVIRELTERARYFMLYLLSCPHGNRLGLFVLDPGYAASDLTCGGAEWEPLHVTEALLELRDRGRISWDQQARVVFVRNYIRYNSLANQSVVKGAIRDLESIPKTPLLGELLEVVLSEMEDDEGNPKRNHYGELAEALRERGARVDPGRSHRAGHGVEHGAEHSDGHRGTRARARAPSLPTPTEPSPPEPSQAVTDPPQPGRGEHGGEDGEDGESLEVEIRKALGTARTNIVHIHGGTDQPVEIHGHQVGVGLEVEAFRRLCREGRDPPHIIAAAIRFLPEVTELEPPVSLARWGADDGPAIYEACIGRAYKEEPPAAVTLPDGVRSMPTGIGTKAEAARCAELQEQVEKLRAEGGP